MLCSVGYSVTAFTFSGYGDTPYRDATEDSNLPIRETTFFVIKLEARKNKLKTT